MKEYCIYNIWNGGKPFISNIYNNLDDAILFVKECVELEKERGRPYYVDNDFFKNEFPASMRGKYYCIKCREITPWIKYEELETKDFKNYKRDCKILKIY